MNIRNTLKCAITQAAVAAVMVCGFMLPDAARAAVMPTYDVLPPIAISGTIQDLNHVAVSLDGLVYVTEGNRSRVAVYSTEGTFVRTISPITTPVGIAVNSKGNIYVSSTGASKNVVIKNSEGTTLGSLGIGNGEFTNPTFVAVDPQNDDVYVVDSNVSSIKVYNETGTWLRTITDTNVLIAAAVYGDELYVLDQPTLSMKIRVFDKQTGVEKTSFGSYGIEIGQMRQPKSMAFDTLGRLFVVDYFHRVVYCYDGPNRTLLGYVNSNGTAYPFNSAQGVGVSKSGKLFVADRNDFNLKVFGLDNYTILSAAPASFSFALNNGVSTPASGTLSLGNTGKGLLTYAISTTTTDGAPWIQLSGTSGTIAPLGGTAAQTVTMDGTGLAAGSYTGTITVRDVDSTNPAIVRFEKKIPVTLDVSFIVPDTTAPVTTATPVGFTFGTWTGSGSLTVNLSADDGAGSGVAAGYPKYCIDTANTCTPDTSGASLNVTCAIGSACIQYVRFHSVDNANNTETIKTAQVKQDRQAAPGPPTGITLSAMMTWGPAVSWNTVGAALTYNVYRSSDNASWGLIGSVSAPTTAYTDTTAPGSNTTYYWTVTAANLSGESSKPSGVSGRTALLHKWNMVSSPYDTGALDPKAVYGAWANRTYVWTSTSNSDPDNSGGYSLAATIEPGEGQFIYAYNNSTVLNATGSANPLSITVMLLPGWNMISNQTLTDMTNIGANWQVDASMSLTTAITGTIIGGDLFIWDENTYDSMNIALDNPVVAPWKGYWILNLDSVSHTLTIQ